jgi:CRP/FNR family transcriptional regulator, anaerobic regulatory protein
MDNLSLLKETLMSKLELTDEELLSALQICKLKNIEKGYTFTEIGKIENFIYFILDGMARSYFLKNDKEISLDFHFSGDFATVYESFLDRNPALHALEALTDCVVLSISHEDIQNLLRTKPKFEAVGKILVDEQFKKSSTRVKDLLSLSATEYYTKLVEAHPKYVMNIPLKYLASYLHITPESLSRIRKQLGGG